MNTDQKGTHVAKTQYYFVLVIKNKNKKAKNTYKQCNKQLNVLDVMCIYLAYMTLNQWDLIPFDFNLQRNKVSNDGLFAQKTSGHQTEEKYHPSYNSRKEVHQVQYNYILDKVILVFGQQYYHEILKLPCCNIQAGLTTMIL